MESELTTVMDGQVLAIIGAVCAAALAGAGSCLGVAAPGQKGAGVLAEKPNLFGKILILTALPGSQGVYGLLIAIFTLFKIGALGGTPLEVSHTVGMKLLWAGLLMGFAGLTSAWLQGKVAAANAGMIARQESMSGKAIVLSVIIETYAIFGLLISILIINSIQL